MNNDNDQTDWTWVTLECSTRNAIQFLLERNICAPHQYECEKRSAESKECPASAEEAARISKSFEMVNRRVIVLES